MAEIAAYYFSTQLPRNIAAFTDKDEFLNPSISSTCPVLPISETIDRYSPHKYDFFVAIGYKEFNKVREDICADLVAKGYALASFIHPSVIIPNNVTIGYNSFILENNIIQPFSKIGNGVYLWSGNHIGHHSFIGDYCFVASHVVVSGHVVVENNCFVGVNATIREGIKIGCHSLIGAGALVMKTLPSKSVCAPHGTEIAPFTTDNMAI